MIRRDPNVYVRHGFTSNEIAHVTGTNALLNSANQWVDRCSTGDQPPPPPWAAGGYQWVIPQKWFVPGWPTNDVTPNTQTQTFTIDANGTVSISKFGKTVTRTTTNVITTSP